VPRYGLIFAAVAVLATAVAGTVPGDPSTGSAVADAAAPAAAVSSPFSAAASALSPSRQAAKRRALAKCRRIDSKPRRTACLKKVRKRFAAPGPVVPPQGPIGAVIDVRDKYFAPAVVSIDKGESILWSWGDSNIDAHNVTLYGRPDGVDRLSFSTPNSPSINFDFRRTFTVPGQYDFACSIHHLMTMTVEVSP
jgi:plastocyanin